MIDELITPGRDFLFVNPHKKTPFYKHSGKFYVTSSDPIPATIPDPLRAYQYQITFRADRLVFKDIDLQSCTQLSPIPPLSAPHVFLYLFLRHLTLPHSHSHSSPQPSSSLSLSFSFTRALTLIHSTHIGPFLVIKAVTTSQTGNKAAGIESGGEMKVIAKTEVIRHMTKMIEWKPVNIEVRLPLISP